MKVVVLIKGTEDSEKGVMPEKDLLMAMGAFNKALIDAGILVSGEGLHPSSEGKRVMFNNNEKTVADGPFTPTEDLVAGYWVWKVESMEEAVEWVKRIPQGCKKGVVEIRGIFCAEDFSPQSAPAGLTELEAQVPHDGGASA